jgi:hypothetical protein
MTASVPPDNIAMEGNASITGVILTATAGTTMCVDNSSALAAGRVLLIRTAGTGNIVWPDNARVKVGATKIMIVPRTSFAIKTIFAFCWDLHVISRILVLVRPVKNIVIPLKITVISAYLIVRR